MIQVFVHLEVPSVADIVATISTLTRERTLQAQS